MDRKSSPERLSTYSDGVFVLVNATYLLLCGELVDRSQPENAATEIRRTMRMRGAATLLVFAIASLLALKLPLWGLGLCCICLALYVRPEAPVIKRSWKHRGRAGRRDDAADGTTGVSKDALQPDATTAHPELSTQKHCADPLAEGAHLVRLGDR